MNEITVELHSNGVAIAMLDDPERRVNTMTPDLLTDLGIKVMPLIGAPAVKAVVFASSKPGTFIAGADIKLFAQADDPNLVSELDGAYSRMLTRLSRSPKPVVAAVHGAALGGGLEVALACHYILASDHPLTVMGLPEVQLGIMPAAGGTQRLPMRIGLLNGLEMMLSGRQVRAQKALSMGLIDEISTPEKILERAEAVALDLAESRIAPPKKKIGFGERLVSLPLLRDYVFAKARKKIQRTTRGNYPGPMKIIECVELGLKRGLDAGLEREIDTIGELLMTPQSRSLIWLFVATQEMKSSSPDSRKVTRMALLVGKPMGAGLASISLKCCPVVVHDISTKALENYKDEVWTGLAKHLQAGAITLKESQSRWARLSTTTEVEDIAGSDLVIEAVSEDLELKRKVLAQIEDVVGPETVFGSNTSALSLSAIAAQARHKERVVGMHYFPPVHKIPLLELVAPDKAAPWAVDTAKAFGQAQGKTVIVVKDRPGFYTTRILSLYLNEALRLLEEGARMEDIDEAMKDFGFPAGPLTLIDEKGIDSTARVFQDLSQAFGGRWPETSDAVSRILKAGFLGRKSGRGFYIYPVKKKVKRRSNPEIYSFFPNNPGKKAFSAPLTHDRLSLAMVNEAARCLEEEVIGSPRDGDVAAVLGLGFPPFRGGPFHHVDAVGAQIIVNRLEELAGRHGSHFVPAQILVDNARAGKTFFGQMPV
jgi:3-hydroxyacyl-CoA dehydrogenase/enoyl-CoA hydratase/3-hydroxybutyryl-CoA epimerase